MRRVLVIALSGMLALSSCTSYNTATGAYTGATFGQVLGSAIGGLSGGWRGHELGTIVGTVGGAVAGAAIGAAADRASERRLEGRRIEHRGVQGQTPQSGDESGFDPTNSGDDRIVIGGDGSVGTHGDVSVHLGDADAPLVIRNARVEDASGDGVLTRGEQCRVMFEIYNTTSHTMRNVSPIVEDLSGNKHVQVSPNLLIESIAPFQGVRYTASILADRRLKAGQVVLRVGVAKGGSEVESQTQRIVLPTQKYSAVK